MTIIVPVKRRKQIEDNLRLLLQKIGIVYIDIFDILMFLLNIDFKYLFFVSLDIILSTRVPRIQRVKAHPTVRTNDQTNTGKYNLLWFTNSKYSDVR